MSANGGRRWVTMDEDGFLGLDQWTVGMLLSQHRARLEWVTCHERHVAACEAMSHFLVWVYLEASVCRTGLFLQGPGLASRERMLTVAIEVGLLRLEWRRP